MARLFYHKPRYAILDECTSGVTIDMEQRFCERVKVSSPSIRMPSHRRCSLLPADANQWSLFGSLCSLSSHHSPCVRRLFQGKAPMHVVASKPVTRGETKHQSALDCRRWAARASPSATGRR